MLVVVFALLFLSNWKRVSAQGSVNCFIGSLLIVFFKALINDGSVQMAKENLDIVHAIWQLKSDAGFIW